MHNSKRKALLITVAMLLCVILLMTAFCEAYFRSSAYYYQDAGVRKGLSGTLDTLIIGSSHGFRAFVPQVLDAALGTSSYNLCCPMMTMRGRYDLLKKEIARNPIHTVIMELSYNALTRDRAVDGPEGEIYLLGRLDSITERISCFFRAIEPQEYTQVLHDTFLRSKTAWSKLLSGAKTEPQLKAGRGFLPEPSNDMTIPYAQAFTMWFDNTVSERYRAENEEYLDKCIRLCQDNNIRVILVVTPLADQMLLGYSNLETIRQHELAIAEKHGIEFYDFNLIRSREDYPAATAFFDELHLSESGAKTFTRSFAELLQKADAKENIDCLFYENYEQAGRAVLDGIQAAEANH